MLITILQVLTAILIAIAMSMALAHLLELPGKMRLSKEVYYGRCSRRIRGHRSHDRSLAAYSISRSDTNARAGHITLAKRGLERTGERMRLCLFQVTSRNAPRG